ncbi:MAG: Rrf2 family transcriptional regulator, partial [Spirochaetales bacterium]
MRLTHKSEYALLALIDLTEHYRDTSLPDTRAGSALRKTIDIAEAKAIPKKYLEQILLSLKRSGYVSSRQGAEGGYKLAKPPGDIHLAEIIRLMDGPLAPADSVSTYFYQST